MGQQPFDMYRSGHTAISVARHRPDCKIIAITPHDETIRRMQLCWGVEAIKGRENINSDEMVNRRLPVHLGQMPSTRVI